MGEVLLYFLEISAGAYYDFGTFSTGKNRAYLRRLAGGYSLLRPHNGLSE